MIYKYKHALFKKLDTFLFAASRASALSQASKVFCKVSSYRGFPLVVDAVTETTIMIAEGKDPQDQLELNQFHFQFSLQLEHSQLGGVQEILAQETLAYTYHE